MVYERVKGPPRFIDKARALMNDAYAIDADGLLRFDEFHSLCSKHQISKNHGGHSGGILQNIDFSGNCVDVRPMLEYLLRKDTNEHDRAPNGPVEILKARFQDLVERKISKAQFCTEIGILPYLLPKQFTFEDVMILVRPHPAANLHQLRDDNPFCKSIHGDHKWCWLQGNGRLKRVVESYHSKSKEGLLMHEGQTDKDVTRMDDPWFTHAVREEKEPAGQIDVRTFFDLNS